MKQIINNKYLPSHGSTSVLRGFFLYLRSSPISIIPKLLSYLHSNPNRSGTKREGGWLGLNPNRWDAYLKRQAKGIGCVNKYNYLKVRNISSSSLNTKNIPWKMTPSIINSQEIFLTFYDWLETSSLDKK